MKRLFLTAVLILTVYLTSMGNPVIAQGPSNSVFGDYKIVALDEHVILNGKELDKYLISYEKPELKIIVAVDKQKKCKKYYVISGQLPIQYECNGKFFGIMKLDKDFQAKGFSTSMDKLNKDEFYRQRILTTETKSTLDHLVLIASYYPGLINEKGS